MPKATKTHSNHCYTLPDGECVSMDPRCAHQPKEKGEEWLERQLAYAKRKQAEAEIGSYHHGYYKGYVEGVSAVAASYGLDARAGQAHTSVSREKLDKVMEAMYDGVMNPFVRLDKIQSALDEIKEEIYD